MSELLIVLLTVGCTVAAIATVVWFARREVARTRGETAIHSALGTFGPAQAAVLADPRQLLTWYPLAQAARALQPEAFQALDAATGRAFPFSRDDVERAHAKVSADWLGWEKAHDEEYRLKGVAAEQEMARATGDTATLARKDRALSAALRRVRSHVEGAPGAVTMNIH